VRSDDPLAARNFGMIDPLSLSLTVGIVGKCELHK
jgi:hypothetical protein